MQSEYSLFWRGPEGRASANAGEELGIGFVPFSPLGAAFLTAKIDENMNFYPTDFRNFVPRFSSEVRKANRRFCLARLTLLLYLPKTAEEPQLCAQFLLHFLASIPHVAASDSHYAAL